MQTIKKESLKKGMKFSAPVFFDDGKYMFLAEHKPVAQFHLNAMSRWKIPYVITHGKEIFSTPSVDVAELEAVDGEQTISDSIFSAERKILGKSPLWAYYSEAVKNMEVVYQHYKKSEPIDKALIDDCVKFIYKLVSDDKRYALSCVICPFEDFMYYAVAAVDVAVLSVIMAQELEFPQRTIIQIITAALLHDLEMAMLSDSIVNKKGKLTPEEFELLKIHPLKTARYVTEVLMYPREIAVILMQHHERWDGTGYPEGRKKENIDPAARVLSVADAFEAMCSEKSYRGSMIAYDAVKNLLNDKEKRFDPSILKAFIKSIGLYPPGTYVVLSDSSLAKIVESNSNSPFMPTVEIVSAGDSKKARKKGDIINLKEQRNVFILRAMDLKELDSLAG